jgi:hypothetical protein
MKTGLHFITWRIAARSHDKAEAIGNFLKRTTDLSLVFTDRIITLPGKREETRTEQHRLGDYFERLEVLPGSSEATSAIRLFFQRKPDAPAFWKDLMVRTLGSVREYDPTTSITLDYRIDDEERSLIAAKVPAWFRHLGNRSRGFWEMSARYLLNHPEFTFPGLEQFSHTPESSLRALHRNSYRAIKLEKAPNPLSVERDPESGRNVYHMEPVVRDEILCITMNTSQEKLEGSPAQSGHGDVA